MALIAAALTAAAITLVLSIIAIIDAAIQITIVIARSLYGLSTTTAIIHQPAVGKELGAEIVIRPLALQ